MPEQSDWLPDQTPDGRDRRLLHNQRHTALLARITPRALADWPVKPVAHSGREALYDWHEVLDELLRRRAPSDSQSAAASLDAARARLATEQADKVAMENAVARRELIYAEHMAEIVGGALSVFRAKLLNLHVHVGSRFGSDAANYVHTLLIEALAELSSGAWLDKRTTDDQDDGDER